ncbi:MAG: DNA-directed RNA polymerase subunit F [Candidatus Woesearchaeota archaeon]|jgi:DNA-directed RNA polymerase subunit F
MSNPIILSETSLNVVEVKKEIASIKKRDEELGLRSQRCEEYINQFAKLTQKAASEIKEKITSMEVPRMKEEYVNKLIDIMPVNEEDIKVVLSGYGVTVNKDNLKKINDVLDDFRK